MRHSSLRASARQGSSVVEQGTHKPLVGSSTLPPGTTFLGPGNPVAVRVVRVARFEPITKTPDSMTGFVAILHGSPIAPNADVERGRVIRWADVRLRFDAAVRCW